MWDRTEQIIADKVGRLNHDFGAFNLLPGKDDSRIFRTVDKRVENVTDYVKEGEAV